MDFINFHSISFSSVYSPAGKRVLPTKFLADLGVSSLAFWPPVWRADPILFIMGAVKEAFLRQGRSDIHSTIKTFYEGQIPLAGIQARMNWL